MQGDARSCVEWLFREYGAELEDRLYRITGNHADAIELTQETIVRMLQIKDMEAIRDRKAYMFTIGVRLAVERVRQRRGRQTLDVSDPALEPELAHEPKLAEQIDRTGDARRLEEVLAELPPRVRAAFWLQHAHGMSYEEIARHLGVSKETVKKDLSKAILHCRQRLGPP
jgi:RNA polymerase sigma-70 factor (ECF subfamily)